ncbi:MAG: Lrp/AsnC family transcriptional regulator [Spirochaetia bacterium]|nr:Lrp/AsnC family transcriptional regulator [Spirochaetia bacterium]
MDFDTIDYQLLQLLHENGRISNKEIAKHLSIAEGTVRNRLKKLINKGILKVQGLTNPSLRSDKQVVYALVKVALHKGWDETAQRISDLEEVTSVSLTTGRFDLLVEAFINPHSLYDFINERLGNIDTIDASETLISVKHYKKWV